MGAHMLLFVKGGAHGWRLDYTFQGRRKALSLGTYPSTTLAIARRKADAARDFPPGATSYKTAPALPRRSRWREYALMHVLLSRACNPDLSLRQCMQQWHKIAARLREAPRLRPYQCEVE